MAHRNQNRPQARNGRTVEQDFNMIKRELMPEVLRGGPRTAKTRAVDKTKHMKNLSKQMRVFLEYVDDVEKSERNRGNPYALNTRYCHDIAKDVFGSFLIGAEKYLKAVSDCDAAAAAGMSIPEYRAMNEGVQRQPVQQVPRQPRQVAATSSTTPTQITINGSDYVQAPQNMSGIVGAINVDGAVFLPKA